ncbi:hypothetical protein EV382_2801 [Micromonospora violae]|uniref:FtsH ternary system domain-containing protein n=1 Tax=Micromonospora violae TaxID=1278207 RepID=A0A4Q7UEE5_9ACTN|nr:hypothetical protein [Micromonospora violae]RZT79585.1 hypothetical protein EV382_2801 [Micromonospora violae]
MTAETTARAVLRWAIRAEGPIPSGDLTAAGDLATPSEQTRHGLAVLAAACAARLGAGSPPFGDDTPADTGGVLLAAALGARAEAATRLVGLAEPLPITGPAGWSAALARHAITERALVQAAPLAESFLAVSPLSRVLHRPTLEALAAESHETEMALAGQLLDRPGGERVLRHAWAAPSSDPDALRWRSLVLDRLVTNRTGWLLDLYVLARLRHGPAWDRRIRIAIREASRMRARPSDALAVLRFWIPLARLDCDQPDLLRSRPLLDGHRPVLDAILRLGLLPKG